MLAASPSVRRAEEAAGEAAAAAHRAGCSRLQPWEWTPTRTDDGPASSIPAGSVLLPRSIGEFAAPPPQCESFLRCIGKAAAPAMCGAVSGAGVYKALSSDDRLELWLGRLGAEQALVKTGDRLMFTELNPSKPPGDAHLLPEWCVQNARDLTKSLSQQQVRARSQAGSSGGGVSGGTSSGAAGAGAQTRRRRKGAAASSAAAPGATADGPSGGGGATPVVGGAGKRR